MRNVSFFFNCWESNKVMVAWCQIVGLLLTECTHSKYNWHRGTLWTYRDVIQKMTLMLFFQREVLTWAAPAWWCLSGPLPRSCPRTWAWGRWTRETQSLVPGLQRGRRWPEDGGSPAPIWAWSPDRLWDERGDGRSGTLEDEQKTTAVLD